MKHDGGSTPYEKSHSAKPASLKSHKATAGRGSPGVSGKGDQHKSMSPDMSHPDSHAAFESLGCGESGE